MKLLGSMTASMLVVLLDTNVLVAAGFNPKSSSAQLVEAARTGRIRLVWSEAILGEYRATIARIPMLDWPAVRELFTPESRSEPEGLNEAGLELIIDPADRKFAALARATGATLVTADRHLLSVRDQLDVVIRKPSEVAAKMGL